MSDVYSGYKKAIRESNKYRRENELPEIIKLYCNAHARRYFESAGESFEEESEFFLKKYRQIYRLENLVKKVEGGKKLRARQLMLTCFTKMEQKVIELKNSYSSKSSIGKAMSYFFNNYKELTFFTSNPDLPIDNNSQERLFRSPVVGRKTWYGTHSKRGARTACILFTLVESCKLNKVNPRDYFKSLVDALLRQESVFTPWEFKQGLSNQ
jgi:hypothetical protein